jgi:hypothetical protein
MIKKMFWLSLLLLAALATACGGAAEPSTHPQPAPTQAPAQEVGPAAVAGKPQLVEFYADW